MRISDWSSDVCSSDLGPSIVDRGKSVHDKGFVQGVGDREPQAYLFRRIRDGYRPVQHDVGFLVCNADVEEIIAVIGGRGIERSAEHTSELQSLTRISYAVFCLKKQK